MTRSPRQLFRDYVSSRSPWGPPWWIYGVTYGVANLVRQAVIIAIPAEVSTPVRIASWIVTILFTIGIVNTAAFVLGHRTQRHAPSDAPAFDMPVARPGPEQDAA